MELRGYILKPAPNPKYFGYPNPQIRGRRSKPKPETHKPETRGYPPRTRPAAILTRSSPLQRFFYFYIFYFYFLQKYIFDLEIYRNIPRPPCYRAAGTWPPGSRAAGANLQNKYDKKLQTGP